MAIPEMPCPPPNMLVDVDPFEMLMQDWNPGRDGTPVLLTITYVQGDSTYVAIRRLAKEMPEWTEESLRITIDALAQWRGSVTVRDEDSGQETGAPDIATTPGPNLAE